jgi:hypothetical protein
MLFNGASLLAQDTPAPATPAPTTQPAQTGGGGGGGGFGGGGNFRQQMEDRIKTALKATDDEWAVISPLLDKVMTAQRATMQGRFGGFGRRGGGGPGGGGPGGPGGGGPGGGGQGGGPGGGGGGGGRFGQASPEADALNTALQSDGTTDADIKTKLQALRDARKKAAADLDAARADLQKVLTLRQEATLVSMGLLE